MPIKSGILAAALCVVWLCAECVYGQYSIVNAGNWKPLGAASPLEVALGNDHGMPSQRWWITQQHDNTYTIVNAYTATLLGAASQLEVKMWNDQLGRNQRWWIIAQGDGTSTIVNAYNNKLLDMAPNGVAVYLAPPNNWKPTQRWLIR